MGLQFRKRIKICKGVNLNLSKTGVGISVGTKGARYSMHSNGRRTATFGIPGTGLYYTKNLGNAKKKTAGKANAAASGSTAAATQEAQETFAQYEEYIEAIRTIHRECEMAINWNVLASQSSPAQAGGIGPRERKAQEDYNRYRPSLAEQLMKSKEQARRAELQAAIEEARRQDAAEASNKALAQRILAGDLDAYCEAIENADPFAELAELGSDFEFGTDDPSHMEVEFTIKADEVIPTTQLSLTKTGKLSEKEMPKSAYYDIMQDYVCSCSIRLAREIFAVVPVDTVTVHAVDTVLNTATGHDTATTILSVAFDRKTFLSVNFDRVDASDFVASCRHNMKFVKTTGFKPVDRL